MNATTTTTTYRFPSAPEGNGRASKARQSEEELEEEELEEEEELAHTHRTQNTLFVVQ